MVTTASYATPILKQDGIVCELEKNGLVVTNVFASATCYHHPAVPLTLKGTVPFSCLFKYTHTACIHINEIKINLKNTKQNSGHSESGPQQDTYKESFLLLFQEQKKKHEIEKRVLLLYFIMIVKSS